MYSLIYKLYFYWRRKEKYCKETHKEVNRVTKFGIGFSDWFYNVFWTRYIKKHNSKRYGLNKKYRKEKVIVSLTSFPKRIGTVWITIESLLNQNMKPDMIILWLADSQFDSMNDLPKELLRLQKRGLTIRFCDDLRSHKKYFYAMQEYENDIIILADDDMFYPRDTIKKLMRLHNKYPKDICTITAQVMGKDERSVPSEWRNPLLKEHFVHSDRIQVFTGSGSLYPPGCLHRDAFNKELIQELCPYADDLWITFMAKRKGTRITMSSPYRAFPISIYCTGEGSLYYINAEGGMNDKQWIQLMEHYGDEK